MTKRQPWGQRQRTYFLNLEHVIVILMCVGVEILVPQVLVSKVVVSV